MRSQGRNQIQNRHVNFPERSLVMSLSAQFGRCVVVGGVSVACFVISFEAFAQRGRQPGPQGPGAGRQPGHAVAPANRRQANPNAPANPRGNAAAPDNAAPATTRRGDRAAANNNAPTIVGQVVAYEADKSITV